LPDFIRSRENLARASADFFSALRDGIVRVQIHQVRPLTEAAAAHEDLEARRTMGATVFTL